MDNQDTDIGFYGVLGRATESSSEITLRFYAYAFSEMEGERCVFTIHFKQPAFSGIEVEKLLGQEVELSVFSDYVEVNDIFGDDTSKLVAKSIITEWQPYDLHDYVQRVRGLNLSNGQLSSDLSRSRNKNSKAIALATELMRRAEIKSEASEELRSKQLAAIDVLQRMLTHLKQDD